MLIRSVNIRDVHKRLKREHHSLSSFDIPRLAANYDDQRKKDSINSRLPYSKAYPVKSTAGNNWIIFMQKSADVREYLDRKSISICAVTYHYCEAGIRAFYLGENNTITGFNPHFFERYNERMGLGLQQPLDIVKAFFKRGTYCKTGTIQNGNRTQPIAFRADGLQLGEYHIRSGYLEWRTFVSKELTLPCQHRVKQQLMKQPKIKTKQPAPKPPKTNTVEQKPMVFKSFESLYASLKQKTGTIVTN